MTIRAISLLQPWAHLLAVAAKTIETRNWRASYTGWLAIHASKGFRREEQMLCLEEPFRQYVSDPKNLDLGVIIAVARLESIHSTRWARDQILSPLAKDHFPPHELDFGDYTTGRSAWIFKDVMPLPVVYPCKGSLGLWKLPEDIEAELVSFIEASRVGTAA